MLIVSKLVILIISYMPAYYLGRKLKLLIPKKNEFVSLACGIGILLIYFIIQERFIQGGFFPLYKDSFFYPIVYGFTMGVAFGLSNRDKIDKEKSKIQIEYEKKKKQLIDFLFQHK